MVGIFTSLYNGVLVLINTFFRRVWKSERCQRWLQQKHLKAYRFVMGQQNLLSTIRREMVDDGREVYWFHAASYGEYNVIRPIIKTLRNENRRCIVTFFSSSGYMALMNENEKSHEVDNIFYLPLDMKSNVREFLDIVQPSKAVFAISEYWMNYLSELRFRGIPTYLVSMLVADSSYLLKWYGFPIRRAFKAFTKFMVLDERSKENLAKIGFNNAEVIGDPLFDNAIRIAKEPYQNTIIEKFCVGNTPIFVAGSVSDANDLSLVSSLIEHERGVKFLVIPHEIDAVTLREVQEKIPAKSLLYTECTADTDFTDVQVLVVNILGSLSRIYRYGNWAYVGGGFTAYLHSVIEPAVYGIPVAFGPRIERKTTPKEMVRRGIGAIVTTPEGLCHWFNQVKVEKEQMEVKSRTTAFIEANANFTQKVCANIEQ